MASAGALALTCVASVPAVAQTASDEIVVTAQRREQSAQDVPISITAVKGETLNALGIRQPADLARVTPGLSTANATSGGTPIFAIRGIGLDDFNPNNNSGVAVYVDDVGISSPVLLSGQLFDVDRVEVLKGPQGTLYGRNATGGAVNIYSRLPTEKTEGYATLDYSRWNRVEINGALSGKLADGITARVAGDYLKAFDGYQKDIDTGREFGKPNRLALRGTVQYKSSNDFTAVLSAHVTRDRSIALSPQSDGNEAILGPASDGQVDTGTTDPSKVRVGDLHPRRHDNAVGVSLKLNYKMEDFTVTSITGYDRYHYRSVDNYDGMPGPTFDFFQNDLIKQFYQEVRLASSKGLFGGKVDWIVGGSFSHDSVRGLDASDQSSAFVGAFLPVPDFTTRGLSVAQADYLQKRDSIGLFVNTETHLSDRLSLILGGRYSHDRIAFDGVSTEEGTAAGGILFGGQGAIVDSLDETHKVSKWSYRASLNYKLGRTLLLYGTVSSAYKQGAFYASPALDSSAWAYVKPEEVTAYEIGAKTRLLDGALTLNASVFQNDYKDRQSSLLFISPTSGLPAASLSTIPKARIRGFEAEAVARPLAGLSLSASVSHLDSKILTTASDVRGAPLFVPVPVGSRLSQAPKWTYMVSGRYERHLSEEWKAAVQLDYYRTGRQASVLADPNAFYGPQKRLGARLELVPSGKGPSAALWGRNLTDDRGSTYSFTSFFGGRTVYRQEPRSYGVQLGYSF